MKTKKEGRRCRRVLLPGGPMFGTNGADKELLINGCVWERACGRVRAGGRCR